MRIKIASVTLVGRNGHYKSVLVSPARKSTVDLRDICIMLREKRPTVISIKNPELTFGQNFSHNYSLNAVHNRVEKK